MHFLLPLLAALSFGFVPALQAEVDPSDYLPLKSGNDWTMDMTITSPSGEVVKATARRRLEDTVEKDGKSYIRLRTWTENTPAPLEFTRLIRKDGDGVYSIMEGGKDDKEQTEQKEIALPLKAASAWQRTLRGMKFFDVIIALESITVGDKTYANCFHIRTESGDGKYREDYWEAPKIGTVKSEAVWGDGTRVTATLREFKPAN